MAPNQKVCTCKKENGCDKRWFGSEVRYNKDLYLDRCPNTINCIYEPYRLKVRSTIHSVSSPPNLVLLKRLLELTKSENPKLSVVSTTGRVISASKAGVGKARAGGRKPGGRYVHLLYPNEWPLESVRRAQQINDNTTADQKSQYERIRWGSADVESSDDHGRTPHYDQLIPSLSIDPVNFSVCPGKLWFRPGKRVWFRLRKCFEWPKRLSTIEGIYPDIPSRIRRS
jgi:hypothetical protein